MTSAPLRATLYANGRTPLFLDTAQITFTFGDGPPVTSEVQIARIDYARNAATIVFYESDHEAIEALSLGPRFHTTVAAGEVRTPKRAEEANPDFEISHEMQVTLHALSGGKRDFDPYSQLEGLIAGPLKERRQMIRAEAAINGIPNCGASSRQDPARQARSRVLTKLARLSDAQALSVLEGNRLPDPSGFPCAAAAIAEVRNRRTHLLAVAHMMRRLHERRAQRPFAKSFKPGRNAQLQR